MNPEKIQVGRTYVVVWQRNLKFPSRYMCVETVHPTPNSEYYLVKDLGVEGFPGPYLLKPERFVFEVEEPE